jgi:hypothetical protein
MDMLALFKAKGLTHGAQGILGLSPHKDRAKNRQHYLWALKHSGVVDTAMVALSLTQVNLHQKPYATFGEYNAS